VGNGQHCQQIAGTAEYRCTPCGGLGQRCCTLATFSSSTLPGCQGGLRCASDAATGQLTCQM
jgi:hypothetical protein